MKKKHNRSGLKRLSWKVTLCWCIFFASACQWLSFTPTPKKYLYDDNSSSAIEKVCQLVRQFQSQRFKVENFTVHIFKEMDIPSNPHDDIRFEKGENDFFTGNPPIIKTLRVQTELANGIYRCRDRINTDTLPCPLSYRKGFGGQLCTLQER